VNAGRRPGPRRRLTDADLVALVVLLQGSAHGHAIWNRLTECDVEGWASVSRAQVYYSLGKLAEQQLVLPVRKAGAETRRERRTWRISAKGRRALTAALSSRHWATQRVVPPFMTWVALSDLARPAARARILDDRQSFVESELARERETLANLRQLPPEAEGAEVAVLMVEHVIQQMTLELELLGELRNLPRGR
jgi:DNA-binding PadR family transcriptional regulator